MSVEVGEFYIVTVSFETEAKADEINEIALNSFHVDGIEEFSLNEETVDEILGERAYSGGDIPTEVIHEVEDVTKANGDLSYKYYFFNGDLKRAEDFSAYLDENHSDYKKTIEKNEFSDWNAEWRKHYAPIEVTDELSVVPEWFKKEDYKENKNHIYINPGMGFGTGEHETTFLCLKLLEGIKQNISKKSLCLDFGCGSGILGIGAIKKKDMQVDFVDIDPAALDNCHENLKLNFNQEDLNGHALMSRERYELGEKYDLVFANILEHVLISEKPVILDALKKGSYLVLSGILNHQVDNIISEYSNLEMVKTETKGDWSAILLRM